MERPNAAVFLNWISLRKTLLAVESDRTIILNLSSAKYVDHSTMEKLHLLQDDLFQEGRHLLVIGLRGHTPASHHPLAAREKSSKNQSGHPSDTEPEPASKV